MKKWISSALLMISINVSAQVPTEKALLWQVSGKGLPAPSYIYGTFHLMCPEDLVVSDTLKNKFETTKQLYLELDMDDASLMQQMMMNSMMRGDTSLTTLLTAEEYDTLSARFQELSPIPLMMLNKLKPFFTMSAVFPSLLSCEATEGWERKFMELANEKNGEVKGLETLKEQMDVVDSIPYKVQAQMLLKTLNNIDSTKNSLQQLIKVYKEMDLNKIQQLTEEEPELSNYDNILLEKRNLKWIPVIKTEASKMPTFFAVGAGHLGGENGIIYLLRKEGYTVKPVFY